MSASPNSVPWHFGPAKQRLEVPQLNLLKGQHSRSLSLPICGPNSPFPEIVKFPIRGIPSDRETAYRSDVVGYGASLQQKPNGMGVVALRSHVQRAEATARAH